jgi:hypothetical protein
MFIFVTPPTMFVFSAAFVFSFFFISSFENAVDQTSSTFTFFFLVLLAPLSSYVSFIALYVSRAAFSNLRNVHSTAVAADFSIDHIC